MFSKARASSWWARTGFHAVALGTSTTSAPASINSRALSGNSRSKQVITPSSTPSKVAVANPVPGVSAASAS